MAMSGVTVDDSCVTEFERLKSKHQLRYIIFKVEKVDNVEKIIVDTSADRNKSGTWDNFCCNFPDDDCRLAVFDAPLIMKNGAKNEKPLLISWTGPSASIKKKMISSSSQSALKSKFGLEAYVQVDDRSELLDAATLISDCRSFGGCTFDGDALHACGDHHDEQEQQQQHS